MTKKRFFIFFLLLLPVMLVLFLNYFGDNRFDIPKYHQNDSALSVNCKPIEFPYSVKDKEFVSKGNLSVITFMEIADDSNIKVELLRLCDKVNAKPVEVIFVNQEIDECFKSLSLNEPKEIEVKDCILLMKEGNTVLIDGDGIIRGYYSLPERDEIDRLAVELDILLENGEHFPE